MSQRYIGGLIYNPPGGFSGYFDGSGDYLQLADSTAWDLTGDYTIEMWLYKSSSASQTFFQLGTSSNILLYQNASNAIIFYSGSAVITSSATAPLNQWNHFALVRSGGGSNNTVMYLNGVNVGQATNTTSFTGDASNGVRIGAEYPTGFEFTGYISNVRVVKGTAVYTTAFTPPNGPLQAITNTQLLTCAYPTFRDGSSNNFTITVNGNTAVSTQNPFPQTQLPNPALGNQGNGVYSMSQYQALRSQNLWPASDPYFDFVTLMLHGNGTNGAQNNTFLDSSTNNFTITRNGNTTQGTFTPYGANWSNYFDGTGDFLTAPDNAAFNLSGDFTIEAWVNVANISSEYCVFHNHTSNTNGVALTINSGAPRMLAGNGSWYILTNSSITIAANTWNHIAYTRSGSTWTIWVNGVSGGTATSSTTPTYSGGVQIGQLTSGVPLFFPGYISNLRVLKGTALYTANFTPPAAPLTAVTNTSLLTCADNRFIDDSTNNFTITRNGDVSVQRFSPFNPTTPYAAGTIGGSGYFDGSGDYLSVASSSTLAFGTGDFTVEGWYYPLAYSGDVNTITSTTTADSASFNAVNVNVHPDGSMQIGSLYSTGAGTVPLRTWTYFVVSRVSGTIRLFINGVERSSASNTTNYTSTGCLIGVRFSGGQYYGTAASYISGLKFTVGSGVTSVTVPSAPPTGGNLLTNFTNGGIIDNAMMNDLETVGNAQISTSVSKFGGGSLAFDGNGDWLNMLTTPNITFGSGDFTLEGWLYLNSVSGDQIIFDQRPATTQGAYPVLYMSNAVLTWYISTSPRIQSSSLSTGVWYHFAVSRSGSSTKMFINGNQTGSTYTDTNNYLASRSVIGISAYDLAGGFLNGYLDDVRFTKGYARYTANFTPQRSQWQDQ